MKNRSFVDCFMLMSTVMSLKNSVKLPEMGRPLIIEEFATLVNISLSIASFEIVDGRNMLFEVGGLLTQKWIDARLGANMKTRKMAVTGQIWKPIITNTDGISLIIDNEDTVFWRGFGDEGNVLLSEKFRIHNGCTMDFRKFPFDSQVCKISFGSFRFPSDEVLLQWESVSVTFKELRTNEFRLFNISTDIIMDPRESGNFSIATIKIHLNRVSNHHIICTAVPTIGMTILNYISLWLNISNRTSRININLLSLCINLYFYYLSTCLLQPVPYFKAIDIFIGIGVSFSLLTLLETLLIDALCAVKEHHFHLKSKASREEYQVCVYWIELGIKLGYPTFYIFSMLVFIFLYM